ETTMEISDDPPGLGVLGTPVKPRQFQKFYVRRKSIKLLNMSHNNGPAVSPQEIKASELVNAASLTDSNADNVSKEELDKNGFPHVGCGFIAMKNSEESEVPKDDSQCVHRTDHSKEELGAKCAKSKFPQVYHNGKEKKTNPKGIPKKQRFHRPRILEEGRKPRIHTTTRLRTISMKTSKKEKDNEEEAIVEPVTPEKQSFPKRRKNEARRKVARNLIFDEETVPSCLELSRILGHNFPRGRKRMATFPRRDFHVLISPISLFPMPIWKKKSRRCNRRKNLVRWAKIALSFECLEETLSLVAIHAEDKGIKNRFKSNVAPKLDLMHSKRKKRTKNTVEHPKVPKQRLKKPKGIDKLLIKETSHGKNNELLCVEDFPIQIEETLMTFSSCVAPKVRNKRMKDIAENLIQQLNYQKEHGLSSLADVPLHIEDTLMRSVNYEVPKQPIKTTKDASKLIKEMSKLNINRRVTSLGKAKKKLVTAKVKLDPETIKEWELLMVNDSPDRAYADKETESKWEEEREIFQSHIELFINRMHLLQGNRKFKQWKGSVVDSVVGVFLTQNVSDFLSSNAYMSVAAKFPVAAKQNLESLPYFVEESQEVKDSVVDGPRPTHNGNDDAKNPLEFVSLPEKLEQHEEDAKTKNKKIGIMEDENVDWPSLRKKYTKEGFRDMMHMDTVDWNAVRLSTQKVLADTIIKRGQQNGLARKILKFLNMEAKQNGTVDLEWLRMAPSDLVKRYLLEIEGIGLKSAECVRLLGLKHSAFPVDTNVGRIAVRLGWVPLEPLSNGVQMHQLFHYPSMDSIQKYLWPRLCKLPQETLYELHYQLITCGKVFCTKVIPNCNACPMKSECKYFASAYVSSKVLLEGPEEKKHESDTSMPSYSHDDVDVHMASKITSIEECVSSEYSNQANFCEPMVEFPSSPIAEILDIEDTPWRSPRQIYAEEIPEIDIDIDALKKNIVDALLTGGKMLQSCNDEISKALVVLTPENACIPMELPRKTKYYDRLRTEHVVYVLPDHHELLHDFEKRESDDPSPYLLALWQPGEMSYSFTPPKKKCNSDGSILCTIKTCSYCWAIREQSSNVYRGTILIPCRTAMRAGFPLNGTYFQTNEANHETSQRPIVFSRQLCDGLEKRALYCGSSVTSIFRFVDERRIQLCFWTGFVCMRAFNRKHRNPEVLVRRLHTPPDERGEKYMRDE
ncbi:unnamed protein product, partial [Thlaspi arvense]